MGVAQGGGLNAREDRLTDAAASVLLGMSSQVAILAGGMAIACGCVLMLRKFLGALTAAPGTGTVLAVCAAGLLFVMVGDLAMSRGSRWSSAPTMRHACTGLTRCLTRLGLLLGLAAVCLPPRHIGFPGGLVAIAAVVFSLAPFARRPVAEAFRRRIPTPQHRAWRPTNWRPTNWLPMTWPQTTPVSEPPLADRTLAPSTPWIAGSLRQRFERLALPGGSECVRGRVCVTVAKGTRSGSAHVGFCPPLASHPTVDVTSDYDAIEAIISAAEVLPWGIRVECRLDEPAEETIDIPVDIFVTTAA